MRKFPGLRHWRWTWWRFDVEVSAPDIPLPRIRYGNEGPRHRWLAFSFSSRYGDDIIGIELDLGERG
jgi:hypothetical protein